LNKKNIVICSYKDDEDSEKLFNISECHEEPLLKIIKVNHGF